MAELGKVVVPERLQLPRPNPSPTEVAEATNKALRDIAAAIRELAEAVRELQRAQ